MIEGILHGKSGIGSEVSQETQIRAAPGDILRQLVDEIPNGMKKKPHMGINPNRHIYSPYTKLQAVHLTETPT